VDVTETVSGTHEDEGCDCLKLQMSEGNVNQFEQKGHKNEETHFDRG
jgi:hypothetical protein